MSRNRLDQLRKLPKVELHRHLDGSVRFETILDLSRLHAIDLGTENREELLKKTKLTSPMRNLEAVLDSFWTTQKVLASYEAIKRVTFENIEDAFRDGVRLLELRFAPVFISEGKDLENDEILEGVLDGMSEGMDRYPVQVGLIFIVPRTLDLEKNRAAFKEMLSYRKSGHRNSHRLCGFDLADSEDAFEAERFTQFVEQARQEGLGITIHTGENTSPKHVWKSLEVYQPDRIGHGIKAWEDPKLVDQLVEKGIHLELCPTSNYITRSVKTLEEHPLPGFHAKGMPLSINADDPHLFDIDLVHEYEICARVFGLGEKEFLDINREALPYSFLEEDIVAFVGKHLEEEL